MKPGTPTKGELELTIRGLEGQLSRIQNKLMLLEALLRIKVTETVALRADMAKLKLLASDSTREEELGRC